MPKKQTIERARKARREGKAPSTQAGEFVREEIEKTREGEHGARSASQAIAIGLSEARKAGVDLPPPKKGKVKERTRKSAEYAYEVGQGKRKPKHQPRVARAVREVMREEPRDTVSHEELSRHAKEVAARRKSSGPVGGTEQAGRGEAKPSKRTRRRSAR